MSFFTAPRLIPENAAPASAGAVFPSSLRVASQGGEPVNYEKSTLDYALGYIKAGWHVLPLKPNTKQPAHWLVPNGVHGATNDPAIARKWWSASPDAGIGIAMLPSGLVTVDIDPRNGGFDTMERLEAQQGALVSDVLAYTGGGGEHRVFSSALVANLPGKLGPGVDLKADGYIVVEPSIHPSGKAYAWEASSDPLDGSVPSTLPGWIRDLARTPFGAAPYSPATRMVDAKQVAELRDALAVLPADDYHLWVNFGQALVELGQEGYKLWDEWSQKSSKYDPQSVTRKWRSFKGGAYQLESIFFAAQNAGWVNPAHVQVAAEVPAVQQAPAAQFEQQVADFEAAKADAETCPIEFLTLPGAMGECMAWMLRTAQRRQPLLAMAATISLFATALSQKVASPTRLRTNLYLVSVAGTSSGKDHGRKCLAKALQAAGLDSLIGGDELASGAGLLSRAAAHPRTVFQLDEFGLMLQAIRNKNSGAHLTSIMKYLMQLYGSTDSIFRGAEYADQKMRARMDIEYPCVNLHATTTPDQFFSALGSADVTSGALNRLLVIVSPDKIVARQESDYEDVPQAVQDFLTTAQRLCCGMAGLSPSTPLVMPYDGGAKAEIGRFSDWLDAYHEAKKDQPQVGALWGRAYEMAVKLAMVHSVASSHTDMQRLEQAASNGGLLISTKAMQWGIAFVKHFVGRMEAELTQRMGDSEFDILMQNVARVIRAAGPHGLTTFELGRKCAAYKAKEPRYQDTVHVALVRRNDAIQVKFAPTGGRGKPRLAWVAVEYATQEQLDASSAISDE